MRDRSFWIIVVAAALSGALLRAYYVLFVVRGNIELAGDAATYHSLGQILAGGDGYLRPVDFFEDGQRVATAEFPPGYPMLLAVLDTIGLGAPTSQRLVGALIGAATIVVISMLGRAVAGAAVGAVAAVLAAVSPQLVTLDGALLSEGLFVCFLSATLLGVVEAATSSDDVSRRRWWMLASVGLGLAVMTRSEAILLVPLVMFPVARVPGDVRTSIMRTLTGASTALVFILVWTIRNAVSLGGATPFTTNSATMLAGANCDATYSGNQIGGWRFDCIPG